MLLAEGVAAAISKRDDGRVLRILEIGAGTGGLTNYVLPRLSPDRAEYIFSDLSPLFFNRAEQKFFDYPFIKYQVLDIEKDPQTQNFVPHSFDMILASDVLHATKNLRESLNNVRTLLAPHGLLFLLELEKSPPWSDVVFALTEGWWRFTDADLRTSDPFMDRDSWLRLFLEMGFEDPAALPSATKEGEEGQMVLAARNPATRSESVRPTPAVSKTDKPELWLIFEDRTGVSEFLTKRLEESGHRPVFVRPGEKFLQQSQNRFEIRLDSPEDMQMLIENLTGIVGGPLAGIVHLWSLDTKPAEHTTIDSLREDETRCCHTLMHLVQTLNKHRDDSVKPRLCLVTRGAQTRSETQPVSIAQAPIWGIGQVIISEHHPLSCRMIDLSPEGKRQELDALFGELFAEDNEQEILLSGSARYVARVSRTSFPKQFRISKRRSSSFRVECPSPGILDNLTFRETKSQRARVHEVVIEVKAVALNFRDVMKALGIYPTENEEDTLLGDECSGRILSVGKRVNHLKKGDEVIALGPGCLSSRATFHAASVFKKPPNLSFEEAVTVPTAFLTAYYALCHTGKMTKGEKVLIHAASGGVGLAAVQIARRFGAEIFATAGSNEKREFLSAMGVPFVMNSRSLEFADQILEMTKGQGVDIVLNSLSGERIAKGLSVLAPHGRFLELGKTDIYKNSSIGLRSLRHNITLRVIDLAQVMQDKPDIIAEMVRNILSDLKDGAFFPLPHRIFPVSQSVAAFRHMAQAKHIGKLVITISDHGVKPVPPEVNKRIGFSDRATYLISGGTGGLGLVLSEWMISNGARNLTLISRSGASTKEAQLAIARMEQMGAHVHVEKSDICHEEDVSRLFDRIRMGDHPLRGIFHCAMVLDDGLLVQQTRERFMRATAPKMLGAWNLHKHSLDSPLDFFVMFSSIASMIGGPGQSNYVAANTFLDAFSHYRHSQGLPGLTINWGRIVEAGYVSRNTKVEKYLSQQGLKGLTPEQVTEYLGKLLLTDTAQIGIMPVDWNKASSSMFASLSRLSELVKEARSKNERVTIRGRESILSAPIGEREELLKSQLKMTAANVLRTSPAKLRTDCPLTELGLDSLMAAELLTGLETCYNVTIPAGKLTAGISIDDMTLLVMALLSSDMPEKKSVAEHQPLQHHDSLLSCLVPLREGGSRANLYCIHPSGGFTWVYNDMVSSLSPGFPVFGIQSIAWSSDEDEFVSIDDMAEYYADLVQENQPDGPYRLFGFCFGGLLAMSMTRLFEQRGYTVEWVGLADSRLDWTRPEESHATYMFDFMMDMYNDFSRELKFVKPVEAYVLEEDIKRLSERIQEAQRKDRITLIMNWLNESGHLKADISFELQPLQSHAPALRGHNGRPSERPL